MNSGKKDKIGEGAGGEEKGKFKTHQSFQGLDGFNSTPMAMQSSAMGGVGMMGGGDVGTGGGMVMGGFNSTPMAMQSSVMGGVGMTGGGGVGSSGGMVMGGQQQMALLTPQQQQQMMMMQHQQHQQHMVMMQRGMVQPQVRVRSISVPIICPFFLTDLLPS